VRIRKAVLVVYSKLRLVIVLAKEEIDRVARRGRPARNVKGFQGEVCVAIGTETVRGVYVENWSGEVFGMKGVQGIVRIYNREIGEGEGEEEEGEVEFGEHWGGGGEFMNRGLGEI